MALARQVKITAVDQDTRERREEREEDRGRREQDRGRNEECDEVREEKVLILDMRRDGEWTGKEATRCACRRDRSCRSGLHPYYY